MCRTAWFSLIVVSVWSVLQSIVIAAGPAGTAAAPARTKPRVSAESAAQANARHARFKLDIAKGEPAATAPAASGAVTVDALSTMIDNMGLEPKLASYDSGEKYVNLTLSRGTWTIPISIDLSPDKSVIWFSIFLTKVTDPTKVPLEEALKLLDSEHPVWPSYFAYNMQYKTIYLYRPLPNENVKAPLLRKTFETLIANLESTSDAWDESKWNPGAKP